MRTPGFLVAAVVATAVIAVSGCATGSGGGSPPDEAFPHPTSTGEVIGQGTVLQQGQAAPQLCLGAVAESYPPQCSGPVVAGWDWTTADFAETAGAVTWGTYAVYGTWDGSGFTLTRPPIPLALYDPIAHLDPHLDAANAGPSDESALLDVQNDLAESRFPGVLTMWTSNGYLFVGVIFDDGTVQDFVDGRYGPGIVVVQSALRAVA